MSGEREPAVTRVCGVEVFGEIRRVFLVPRPEEGEPVTPEGGDGETGEERGEPDDSGT